MPYTNKIFTDDQSTLLTAVLNKIVPANGNLPSAGDLGIAVFIESAINADPALRRLFTEGLAQISITASQRGNDFSGLSDSDKDEVLKEVESNNSLYFSTLVRQCYNGYYTNETVLSIIGYEPISPENYVYKPLDESLLAPQRERAPFWTKV
jgi:hypothetical protein